MQLITPPKIKNGEAIGIISPSVGLYPFATHRFENGIAFLEKLGFRVKMSKHALKNHGYVAATAEERAADIDEMFADREVKMIMTSIGGNHSNQVLKYLDFDLVKRNPKIFVGYSDITVLHYAFQTQANLQTYFGPQLMTQMGEYPAPLPYTVTALMNMVAESSEKEAVTIAASSEWTEETLDWFNKEDLTRSRKMRPNSGYSWLKQGKTKGPLTGGTLLSLNHLAGTKYWVNPQDHIFFLDVPEGHELGKGLALADVDSLLADLDNLGVFESINGLIVGRPFGYSAEQDKEFTLLIQNYTNKFSYPVVMNVDLGHTDPIVTLPYESIIELDSEQNTLQLFP